MTDAYLQPWNSLNNLKYELMKILHGFRVLKYALWQKTKYRNCRKSAESFLNKKVPLANNYHCYKTAKNNVLFKYHFGFNNKKSHFQASMVSSLWWSWPTLWELCPEHTKCLEKSSKLDLNSLNNSKIELMKLFCTFQVFKYALMVKDENPETLEINIKLFKSIRNLLKCNPFVI